MAPQIGARITDVGHDDLVRGGIGDDETGERGSHTGLARIVDGFHEDGQIGRRHRIGHLILVGESAVGRGVQVGEGADGDGTGDFTGTVAAHSVGHEVQTVDGHEGVLVAVTNASDIRASPDPSADHLSTSSVTSPMWMRSPTRRRVGLEMNLPFTEV